MMIIIQYANLIDLQRDGGAPCRLAAASNDNRRSPMSSGAAGGPSVLRARRTPGCCGAGFSALTSGGSRSRRVRADHENGQMHVQAGLKQ
jgi:hypothetical protein